MMKLNLVSLAFLLVMLTACSAFPAATDTLGGNPWELYAIGKTFPIAGRPITITFEDGQVSGSAGCNSYGGSYQVNGDKIAFSEVFSTMMACPEPEGVMEQEMMFLQFLGDAQRFEMADGQLQVFRSDGEALTFVPVK